MIWLIWIPILTWPPCMIYNYQFIWYFWTNILQFKEAMYWGQRFMCWPSYFLLGFCTHTSTEKTVFLGKHIFSHIWQKVTKSRSILGQVIVVYYCSFQTLKSISHNNAVQKRGLFSCLLGIFQTLKSKGGLLGYFSPRDIYFQSKLIIWS